MSVQYYFLFESPLWFWSIFCANNELSYLPESSSNLCSCSYIKTMHPKSPILCLKLEKRRRVGVRPVKANYKKFHISYHTIWNSTFDAFFCGKKRIMWWAMYGNLTTLRSYDDDDVWCYQSNIVIKSTYIEIKFSANLFSKHLFTLEQQR